MQGFLRTDHDSKRKESRKSMRGIKSQAQKTRSLRSLRVAHSKVSSSGRQQCHAIGLSPLILVSLSATCNACLAAGCEAGKQGSEGKKEGRMSWAIWMRMHCISLENSPRRGLAWASLGGLPLFFFTSPAACWWLETAMEG
jgi:hypothetical protein